MKKKTKKKRAPKVSTPQGGRPRTEVDPDDVERLAGNMCSVNEIGAALDVSPDTLTRRFADSLKTGREKGLERLRSKQFEMAIQGNVVMLIWLGKQYLGQSEKVGITVEDAKAIFENEAKKLHQPGSGPRDTGADGAPDPDK